ncbi:hypothetical protein ACIQZD_12425 [Peribacillus sp. NPDC096447]|uniref:hypothetical protein n=1 Tax=Peribacillus sp. NPDC096447 TaxID=3364394 RepID=UPI003806E8F2
MGIFMKAKPKKAIWFQKAKETDGILDVSSEQVKLQVTIIDLTEFKADPQVEGVVDAFIKRFCRFLN